MVFHHHIEAKKCKQQRITHKKLFQKKQKKIHQDAQLMKGHEMNRLRTLCNIEHLN